MLFEASQPIKLGNSMVTYFRLNRGQAVMSVVKKKLNNTFSISNLHVSIVPEYIDWCQCFSDSVPYDVYNILLNK